VAAAFRIATKATRRAPRLGPDDVATLSYTPGTTGNPKGVMLTHGNWLSIAEVVAQLKILQRDDLVLMFTLAKRNRAWEARELFDLINDVERELATPFDDERSRPSPRRKTSSRS